MGLGKAQFEAVQFVNGSQVVERESAAEYTTIKTITPEWNFEAENSELSFTLGPR